MDTSDSAHAVLKTYETPGIYVTGIRIQDGSIYLSRVMKNGDIYVDTTEDTIMNRDLQEKDQVNIDTVVSDVKQKEVVLKLLEETSGSTPKTLIPKLIENEEPNTLEIKNLNASSAYYCLLYTSANLYQRYLAKGPVSYMEPIFEQLTKDSQKARQLVLDFYGPIFLLYSIYDGAEEKESVVDILDRHVDSFSQVFQQKATAVK